MKEKLIDFAKSDKGKHFGVGFAIALLFSIIFSPAVGFIVGTLVGIGKEAHDEWDYNGADFFDFFATLIGTTVGVFAYGILDILF